MAGNMARAVGRWPEQLGRQHRGRSGARPPVIPPLTAATSAVLATEPPHRAIPMPWCPSTAGARRLCVSHLHPNPSQPLGSWLGGGEGGKGFRSGPWVGSLADSSEGGAQDETSDLGRA